MVGCPIHHPTSDTHLLRCLFLTADAPQVTSLDGCAMASQGSTKADTQLVALQLAAFQTVPRQRGTAKNPTQPKRGGGRPANSSNPRPSTGSSSPTHASCPRLFAPPPVELAASTPPAAQENTQENLSIAANAACSTACTKATGAQRSGEPATDAAVLRGPTAAGSSAKGLVGVHGDAVGATATVQEGWRTHERRLALLEQSLLHQAAAGTDDRRPVIQVWHSIQFFRRPPLLPACEAAVQVTAA